MAADIFLVAAAYFAAFFLRLGFQFSGEHWDVVARAFPIVLVVRSSCFYVFGLYRGVWKYTSTPDIVKIVKAVTVGSAVTIMLLVFFYRFEAFPRSMFVMEFFLLILGLAGARFASRLFHEFGKDVSVTNAARVAIVGAGDAGESLLREIRSTEGKRSSIVCFLDDDKGKDGLTLQGVPITGPVANLAGSAAPTGPIPSSSQPATRRGRLRTLRSAKRETRVCASKREGGIRREPRERRPGRSRRMSFSKESRADWEGRVRASRRPRRFACTGANGCSSRTGGSRSAPRSLEPSSRPVPRSPFTSHRTAKCAGFPLLRRDG